MLDAPRVACSVTLCVADAGAKVADTVNWVTSALPAIVAVAGTDITELLLESKTMPPAFGAAPESVIVQIAKSPALSGSGKQVNALIVGALIVKTPVSIANDALLLEEPKVAVRVAI